METSSNEAGDRSSVPSNDPSSILMMDQGDHNVDPDAVEHSIVRRLEQMSFEHRNTINEEIHGVRNMAPEETPSMLEDSLLKFDQELSLIRNKTAFDRANTIQLSPPQSSFVHDQEVRLSFLRAELFNPGRAARRFVNYLEYVVDLFGEGILERPGEGTLTRVVRFSDLDKDDIEVLREGYNQLLPFRDRVGRRIMIFILTDDEYNKKHSLRSKEKVIVYLFSTLLEDVETQRLGVITVTLPGKAEGMDPTELRAAMRCISACPVRICSSHFCGRETSGTKMLRAALSLILGDGAVRFRHHIGEDTELLYQLMGFGIPVEFIPITDTGNVKTKNLLHWIKVRREIESSDQDGQPEPIECPDVNDVIFRSGLSYPCHSGNQTFRDIIESVYEQHVNTNSREIKVRITWMMVRQVEEKGGRFLLWDKRGWWTVITDRSEIRTKVASAIKEYSKRIKANKNVQINASSTYEFQSGVTNKRQRVEKSDGEAGHCGCFF